MQLANKRLVRLAEVKTLTGLSRASIYSYIKKEIFPAPAKFGKSSLWEYTEIQEWINQRINERNNQRINEHYNQRGYKCCK